jgi:hypothetical protein
MTNNSHPITPPPELVQEWAHMLEQHTDTEVFAAAARWGADQELEACCEWIPKATPWDAEKLRAARRPKPPSLKEQALAALNEIEDSYGGPSTQEILIRRALEQLPDHE